MRSNSRPPKRASSRATVRESAGWEMASRSAAATIFPVDEGDNAVVTLTLAEAPAAGTTVTVPIAATPGEGLGTGEYSGVPSSVTFNAGQTSRSFTVATVDDSDDEPDRTLTLSLGTLPDGYVPGTHETLALTVADNDDPIVSASFGAAAASVAEGVPFDVTVSLSQAPEREVALPIVPTRGANLAADEYSGVPADVTFAADETSKSFTVTFEDDAAVEGNETLTLTFGAFADSRVTQGANTQFVLTVEDDDGPPAAPDVTVQTGDGYAELSWAAVANDSPVLRYEVRWKEEGGAFVAWVSAGWSMMWPVPAAASTAPTTRATSWSGTARATPGRPTMRSSSARPRRCARAGARRSPGSRACRRRCGRSGLAWRSASGARQRSGACSVR